MADRPTLLLVHAYAPPTPGGTPVVLHRLLSALPGVDVVTLTDRARRRAVRVGGPLVLPGRYRFVPKLPSLPPRLQPLRMAANVLLALAAGLRGAVLARRADWVLSVSDEGFSPLAGAIAARLARRPHLVMVFDLWAENAYAAPDRWLAARLERPLWRSAAAVVVYCEEMADHYRSKHAIECAVIATPIDPSPAGVASPRGEEVLVAGAIYWAQEDAVRRLLRAAPRAGLEVAVLGDERDLRARGLAGDRHEPAVAAGDFAARVRAAGILFVGLSFDSPYPAVVRTATPARFAEYMGSGVPMLVHAPADSHIARYARREDVAEVVDEADDGALQAGLQAIVCDPARAGERAARARELALTRHDTGAVRARFAALLVALRRGP